LPFRIYLTEIKKFGGPEGIRTLDLFHAMEARSQLRHRPTCVQLPQYIPHAPGNRQNAFRRSAFFEPTPESFASYNETMPKTRRLVPVALAIILGLISSSCLYTKRVILRHGKKVSAGTAPTLLTATRDQLALRIANIYNAIDSFQAKVEMTPSVGSVYTSSITEIKDVTAFILFRKPSFIYIQGQVPVVHSKAFEMASDGKDFKVYFPPKNLFVVGANSAPATSKNKLENLRPEAFLSSMLIQPEDPSKEAIALVDATDEDNALYILYFARIGPKGEFLGIGRGVWFDRIDLSIVRQTVYDEAGTLVSDTRYSKWQMYNGVLFPAHIDLNRDKDGYGVVLDIVDMKMNTNLSEDKFILNQPEGAQVREIGAAK
jgi:outer membrane lipoprotein-sorting protein